MRLRIVLFVALLLGAIAALVAHQPRLAAQNDSVDRVTVPKDWGTYKHFVRSGGEYLAVFEASDGTVRVVRLHDAFGEARLIMEIQRK